MEEPVSVKILLNQLQVIYVSVHQIHAHVLRGDQCVKQVSHWRYVINNWLSIAFWVHLYNVNSTFLTDLAEADLDKIKGEYTNKENPDFRTGH